MFLNDLRRSDFLWKQICFSSKVEKIVKLKSSGKQHKLCQASTKSASIQFLFADQILYIAVYFCTQPAVCWLSSFHLYHTWITSRNFKAGNQEIRIVACWTINFSGRKMIVNGSIPVKQRNRRFFSWTGTIRQWTETNQADFCVDVPNK